MVSETRYDALLIGHSVSKPMSDGYESERIL